MVEAKENTSAAGPLVLVDHAPERLRLEVPPVPLPLTCSANAPRSALRWAEPFQPPLSLCKARRVRQAVQARTADKNAS
jgi:hypothetical protein